MAVIMGFKENDFLLVEYTARVKETGEIIETTSKEVAEEAKIYSEREVYEPLLVILGEHRVIKGLEEALYGFEEGEEKEVEIPPDKAYGRRDPGKVRIMPLREFRKAGIDPRPGKIVEINGLPAIIKSVSGGRVVVDFNHPLAGKTLIYKVKVVRRIEDPVEKIQHLLHRRIRSVEPEKFAVTIDGESRTVTIQMPEEAMLLEDVQYAKKAVALEIFKYMPETREVLFLEKHVNPSPKEPEKLEEKAEKKAKPKGRKTRTTRKSRKTKKTEKKEDEGSA